jgi:tetratricopeptide (TPR) repeat protein
MNIAAIMPQLQRAQAMLQSGQAAQAWLLLAPMRAAIEGNGQALRLYALTAQSVGRTDDAIEAMKRIAAIEGSPADIMGAIADTYDKAGRHAEAHDHWDRMIQRHPQIIEAHLNRAIAATQAGLHSVALAAADASLKHFPDDARLLATRAMALKNVGRIEDSVAAFEVAVAADPKRALTRQNQGVALRAACRFDEACEAYSEAERLGARGAHFLSNWAAATLEAARVEDAEALYLRALAEEPNHTESLQALARLRIEYVGTSDAFAQYRAAAQASGFAVQSYIDWISVLMRHNRTDEAADVASEALARHPANTLFRTMEAYLNGMAGDPEPWLDKLEEEAARRPGDTHLEDSIQVLCIRAGRWNRAEQLLQQQLVRDPKSQIVWAKLSIVWRMLGDPREQWLCDYDRLVMVTEVPSPDGLLDPAEYARAMAIALDPLHLATHHPGDQTLRGGTQSSGELFSRPQKEIQDFRDAVRLAAEKAVAFLPDDPDHPFLSRKSAHFGFSGSWSVRLGPEGHHVSHVHPNGWMSSAYYARLPQPDDAADRRHEGWIQFGVPPENYGIELPPRRIVEPRPGRLVLFPSYMWHGTIPFGSGDRLTAAFDYQPL